MLVYFSIDENRRVSSWGSSPVTKNYVEMEIDLEHDALASPSHYLISEEGELIREDGFLLNSVKKDKMEELSIACRNDILGYFEAEVGTETYLFSFDFEAQSNFIGSMTLFTEGLISEIEWTAHKDGRAERIILNKPDFLRVALTAFPKKDAKISRLRKELQPLVENAQTVEEIEAIKW